VTQVIYVPRYDPRTVYLPQPRYASNAVVFGYAGSGFAFNLEFDWNNHKVQHPTNNGWQHNDGPKNNGPRGNDMRNDARPIIVHHHPAQGQRTVNAVPPAAAQREPIKRDQQPPLPRPAVLAKPPVQPLATQAAVKTTPAQHDDAAATPARVGDS